MTTNLLELLQPSNAAHPQRIYGVVTGVVTNNVDPQKLGRVKLRFPWLADQEESWWARVATLMAGPERGSFFLPEVNDEVLVAFDQGDPRFPYVLGSLWSGAQKPPEDNAGGENNLRSLTSRSGMTIRLDDSKGAERIEIADKEQTTTIVLDMAEQRITISAKADITITASDGKLTLSGKGIAIESGAELTLKAQSTGSLEAGGQLTIKGAMVKLN